jgi:hypothetical protein
LPRTCSASWSTRKRGIGTSRFSWPLGVPHTWVAPTSVTDSAIVARRRRKSMLPWSAKAEQLLRDQYAAVGAAARASLPVAVSALEQATATGLDVTALLSRTRFRVANARPRVRASRSPAVGLLQLGLSIRRTTQRDRQRIPPLVHD